MAYAYKKKVEKSNRSAYNASPMNKKSTIITVRISQDLAEKIALAVQKSGRDQSDILRESISLGMDDLALVEFDPMSAAKEKIKAIKGGNALKSLADPIKKKIAEAK